MKEPHIIVCIKSVVLEVPRRGRVVRTVENSVMNPFDRPAVEAAVSLKNKLSGRVTVLSMGPPMAETALLEAVALGADRAVLLSDPLMAGADTLATSAALTAAIRQLAPFDLVVFGTRTADSDTGQVGPQTAVSLDIPLITNAENLKAIPGKGINADKLSDGFLESYEVEFPAALSIRPEAVDVREMGLADLESAFEKSSCEIWDLTRIGLSPETVGETGSPTRVLEMSELKKKKSCEFLDGEDTQKADGLVKQLLDAGLIG